jgi:hypothetical protein
MADYVMINGELYHADQLYHHGIKGMKWGRRRWQNADGSLTPAGEKRYNSAGDVKSTKAAYKQANKEYNKSFNKAYNRASAAYSPFKKHREANDKRWEDVYDKAGQLREAKTAYKDAKFKQKVDAKAAKQKKAQLEKEYGELEDQMTYGKNANTKKNAVLQKRMSEIEKELNSSDGKTNKGLSDKQKKALKVGAAVAGTALAAYGAYKVTKIVKEKNLQIRRGQELAEAHKMLELNANAFSTKGLTNNDQIAKVNQYRNAYTKQVLDNAMGSGTYRARNDSFGTAVKNVVSDEWERRKKR